MQGVMRKPRENRISVMKARLSSATCVLSSAGRFQRVLHSRTSCCWRTLSDTRHPLAPDVLITSAVMRSRIALALASCAGPSARRPSHESSLEGAVSALMTLLLQVVLFPSHKALQLPEAASAMLYECAIDQTPGGKHHPRPFPVYV